MQDGALQIWPDNPGNVCFESELGDKISTDKAFEKATHVIKQHMIVNRSSANSMETRGTNADFDPVSGRCTVYVGVQGVSVCAIPWLMQFSTMRLKIFA